MSEPAIENIVADTTAALVLVEATAGPHRTEWLCQQASGSSSQTRTLVLNCDFDISGPWAGVNDLFAALLPEIEEKRPDWIESHSLELVYVLPHVRRRLNVRSPSLTDLASPEERTRNYAADRATRIVHGLIDLLDDARALGDPGQVWLLLCDSYDKAGSIGRCFFQELLRRKPSSFRLVATIDPGGLAEIAASFSPLLTTRTLSLVLPVTTETEMSASLAEERATELENKIGDDQIDLQIHLPTLLKLWTKADRPDKILRLRQFGLAKYNTLGMYADAVHYASDILSLSQQYAKDNAPLQWEIVLKLLMSYVALQDIQACLQLAEQYGWPLVEHRREWQGQFYYMTAMLHGRYKKPREFEKAEALLDLGIKAIESSSLRDGDRHFQYVFNRNGLAMIRNFQGRHQEAIDLCSEGILHLNQHLGADQHRLHRSVLIYNIAQVYFAIGKYPEALKYYSAAIEMDPNYSEYYNERGSVLLKLDHLEGALADYQRAIELSPPYFEVFTNLGQCYRRLGQLDEAIKAYSRALDLQPAQSLALAGRAKAYEDSGRLKEATSDYTSAIELDASQWELYANRSVVYYERGSLDDSLNDLNRAIELRANDANLFQNRATVLADLKRFTEAAANIASALKFTRDTAEQRLLQLKYDELSECARNQSAQLLQTPREASVA
jgi:tetratricopeptide (TPR) repeat protein